MTQNFAQIDKSKEEMACDIKLSGDTFIRMMSSLENVIYRGCKLTPPGIFNKYDENNSGSLKNLDNLRRQLKIQIKVFLASYEDIAMKNNGKYTFPFNFTEQKIKKLIQNFKEMAVDFHTGDDIYCEAIEYIFKGEFDKVFYLLPHKTKHLGMDPNKQIEYFTRVNGKVYDTTQKAIKEFRGNGSINHVVDIDEEKMNSIINKDPINDVYRIFKLFIINNNSENEEALFEKIKEFYYFHKNQSNDYLFPKSFEKDKFIHFLNSNIKNYPVKQSFFFYSMLIKNILEYKYNDVEVMLYQ